MMTGLITYEVAQARRQDLLATAARHRLVAQARAARRERTRPMGDGTLRLRPLRRLVLQAVHAR